MAYHIIDYIFIYSFLLISLVVGMWASRGIQDIKDYTIAGSGYTTSTLVLTVVATYVGGSVILGGTQNVFRDGIIATLAALGSIVALLFVAFWIAPKLTCFENCMTVGDLMGRFYGRYARILTAIIGLINANFLVAMQILAINYVFKTLLNIQDNSIVYLGSFILITYSAIGGVRAVTITDIFQFLILIAVISFLATELTYKAGGIKFLLNNVASAKFEILAHPRFPYYLSLFLVGYVFPSTLFNPPFIQRMLIAKDKRQACNVYLVSAALLPIIRLLVMLIGLSALVLYPNIDAKEIFPCIIQSLPIGMKGLTIAGLIAILMSTADSFLNSSAVLLVHDIIKPLCDGQKIKLHELKLARLVTFLIGGVSIPIALHVNDIVKLGLYAGSAVGLFYAIPLIAGVMGLKTNNQSFFIPFLLTLVTFIMANWYFERERHYLALPISLMVSAVSFLAVHLITNKGLVTVRHMQGKIIEQAWQPKRKSIADTLMRLLPTPQRIVQYSQYKVKQYGAPYMLFAVSFCITYTLPYFMWTYECAQAYPIRVYLRIIGAMACGLLIVKDKWPKAWLFYLPTFWHLTLLYCLPFSSTVMFLLTQGSVECLINVLITIVLLVALVDWLTFIILTMLGIAVGILFYRLVIGHTFLQLDFSTGYLLVYQGIFVTLLGLIFIRRKQKRLDKKQQALINKDVANQASLLQAAEERLKALQKIQNIGPQNLLKVARDLQKLPVEGKVAQQLHKIEASLIPMAFQLQGIDTKAQDYLRLQVTSVAIKQWLNKVLEALQDHVEQPLSCKLRTQHQDLFCDPERLTRLLVKDITRLQHLSLDHLDEKEQPLLLGIEDTYLCYALPDVEEGYTKQVQALRIVITTAASLPPLERSYWPDLLASKAAPTTTTQALSEQESRRVIKAHYGYTQLDQDTLLYVIPVDLKEIRPKDMDKCHMELGAKPVRANDHYQSGQIDAQAQEKEFLGAVEARSKADIRLVKTALELIKWYHGPEERKSGEPFYLHPLAVAQIVLEYNTAEETILGALLHDTVEDTWMFLQHIETVFGKETAEVVDLVTHLQSIPNSIYKVKLSAEENLRMLERTGNERGLYVKLADRMHNVRTIEGHNEIGKRKTIAEETLAFYVPVAERLGLGRPAAELKERCEAVLEEAQALALG